MFLTHVMWVFDRSARLLYLPVCVYILSVFYLCILPYIDCCWKASTSSEERLIKLGHVSFCICYSMCLTVVQFVKRQFDTFAWSCASINPTPLKQEYGGGIRGRVIQFIKKKKKKAIRWCHWFHFGTALRNNAAFMHYNEFQSLNVSLCYSSSSGNVLLTHTNVFLIGSLLLIPFFLYHYNNVFFLALDTSIFYISFV